jgi:hypothetical protein
MSMASASRPTTPAVLCLWSYDPVDEEEIGGRGMMVRVRRIENVNLAK